MIDYLLSLSMAKELAIVKNNEKGQQIRQYLIKIEQAWNTPEMIMTRALQVSNKTIKPLNEQLTLAEKTIEAEKLKAEYYNALIERGNCTKLGVILSKTLWKGAERERSINLKFYY